MISSITANYHIRSENEISLLERSLERVTANLTEEKGDRELGELLNELVVSGRVQRLLAAELIAVYCVKVVFTVRTGTARHVSRSLDSEIDIVGRRVPNLEESSIPRIAETEL